MQRAWPMAEPSRSRSSMLQPRSTRAEPVGSVVVVVGATLAVVPDLSALSGPVLIPGPAPVGRPDASADLGAGPSIVPAVSREILSAGPAWLDLRSAGERSVIGSPIWTAWTPGPTRPVSERLRATRRRAPAGMRFGLVA